MPFINIVLWRTATSSGLERSEIIYKSENIFPLYFSLHH
nr:MAG TPA: hypothetical protein [Bacteriophage sp.]